MVTEDVSPPHATFFSLSFSACFTCLWLVCETEWEYRIPECYSEHGFIRLLWVNSPFICPGQVAMVCWDHSVL